MFLDVPDLVHQRAVASGQIGVDWLEQLPTIVEHLADAWSLTVGSPFAGGTAAYVVAVVDRTGTDRVLKIAMPLLDDVDAFHRSVRTHELAGGHGCAELIRSDPSSLAMLLERLGPNLDELGFELPQLLDTIADTLRDFWRPVDDPEGLIDGPTKAAWLIDFIVATWETLERPCDRIVIDRALEYCAQRANAFDADTAVLVHGDAHGWNTLAAADGRFKFVDPEGVVSEPAHDLAVPMREYNEPLLAGDTARLTRERAEHLGVSCDVDPEAVWQWGFVERVSTGLANLRDFNDGSGTMFLEVATRCI